jgi:glycosyltransferase involved in cell wall biosynthesis
MKISYAITVCNELEEVKRLVNFLLFNKREQDEMVILFDDKNGTQIVKDYLTSIAHQTTVVVHNFENHFADWKNLLTSYCTGDYIFQIDADEIPNLTLIEHLPEILEMNQGVDVLLVPRVNTVEGLTQEHIQKWGWIVDNQGWVNYPDFQWRIYKNTPNIKWMNKVHERLIGYKTISNLPQIEACSLYHPKTIDRQERQNNYYDTL